MAVHRRARGAVADGCAGSFLRADARVDGGRTALRATHRGARRGCHARGQLARPVQRAGVAAISGFEARTQCKAGRRDRTYGSEKALARAVRAHPFRRGRRGGRLARPVAAGVMGRARLARTVLARTRGVVRRAHRSCGVRSRAAGARPQSAAASGRQGVDVALAQGEPIDAAVGACATSIRNGHLLRDPLELRPLPLSGIPGWHPDGQAEAFHRIARCYQPLRTGRTYPAPLWLDQRPGFEARGGLSFAPNTRVI